MKSRVLLVVAVLACAGPGCTVTADRVAAGSASYDDGVANSGILALEKAGAVVTPRLVERYRALLDLYGKAFVPRVKASDGTEKLPDGTYFITNEVLERHMLMSEWRRMGRKPD